MRAIALRREAATAGLLMVDDHVPFHVVLHVAEEEREELLVNHHVGETDGAPILLDSPINRFFHVRLAEWEKDHGNGVAALDAPAGFEPGRMHVEVLAAGHGQIRNAGGAAV
ncbi:hypothetical protein D9M71_785130 [compost metagenome]